MLREKEPNGALEQALGHLYQSENVPAGFETGWRAAVRREESRMKLVENSTRRPLWRAIVPAFAALVLVVGSLWAGTLDLDLSAAPSEKNAMTETESAGSASTTSAGAPNAMMARSADTATYDLYAVQESSASTNRAGAVDGGTEAAAGQKLVRTASLTLRTTAFETGLENVRALLDSLGGYVENPAVLAETL